MSKSRSGGGIASRVVTRPTVRGGAASANKISPGAVSMIGISRGDHASDPAKTVKLTPQPLVTSQLNSVALGNSLAKNVGAGGPGRGRKVFGSGSQGRY